MSTHHQVAKATTPSRVDLIGLVFLFIGLAILVAGIGMTFVGCGGEEGSDTTESVVDGTSQTGGNNQVDDKKITTTTEHVANIVFRKSSDIVEKCEESKTCTAEVAINVTYSITADGVNGILYYKISESVTEEDAAETALNLPWGMAPDGVYTNKKGEKIDVASYLNDSGKTEVMMGAVWAISNKTILSAEYDTGNRLEGSVNEDGKTISWTIYNPEGQILDSDQLTL